MAPNAPRLRILSVGGNAVSAFLSWRLQATNACDVTLVWKSGFESVAQYGISFRSALFGNERFKPRSVVRTPEEAAKTQKGAFDYVLLCIKALPDVYDLASVIEAVVTPQHTCILINTSQSIGVESYIEERFPKNVVLSLVSRVDITQLGPAEFEHQAGATDLWVGPANWNSEIPASIQTDMAEALAMTLGSGQVDCKVSRNIQQQQFERMAGPIAFHTTSVLFETPNHADLLGLTGVRSMVSDAIDEILRTGEARNCRFPEGFRERIMEEMIIPKDTNSIMYQDYAAKRPMEVETYLGAPIRLAKEAGVKVPRIESLYAILHHVNIANQKRSSPAMDALTPNGQPPPRIIPGPSYRGPGPNGVSGGPIGPPMLRGRGSRAPSINGGPPPVRRGPPPVRRGPPPGTNGYPSRTTNGMPPPGSGHVQRRPSFEGNGLEEFSHLMLYNGSQNDFPENFSPGYGGGPSELELRERELMIRQKELALREREMRMRGGPRPPPQSQAGDFDDDDEDGADYFDPTAYRGPPVNPDNVDMMSITSRRTRKQSSAGQLRHHPEVTTRGTRGNNLFSRPPVNKNRASARLMQDMQGVNENIMDNPLMAYSSDRYGIVDRSQIVREGRESRTGSLTAARLSELQQGPGYNGYPPPMSRATSISQGHPLSPGGRARRPQPPQYGYPNGPLLPSSRPYHPEMRHPSDMRQPPDVRQPTPRHPPGHGNSVAPEQVEQRAGVSNLYPPKSGPQVRSLTGSASASAGSGDSGQSGHIDSENSGFSSQSSLGHRPPGIGVR